jgi:hypothetical protein
VREARRRRTFLSDARCRAPPASRTRRLGRAARHPASRRGRLPIRSCTGWGLPCHPRHRGRGALLPHRFTLATRSSRSRSAVCSLWHFPAGHPDRPLAGTLPCGARTFLGDPMPCRPTRSPGRLRRAVDSTASRRAPPIGRRGRARLRLDAADARGTRAPTPQPVRRELACADSPVELHRASQDRCPASASAALHSLSSMARLLISSAASFSSRGMCATSTSLKAARSCFASSCSGFRWSALTA